MRLEPWREKNERLMSVQLALGGWLFVLLATA